MTPRFLLRETVVALHDEQIEVFGGMHGLRDGGLLDSALAQPQATFAGEYLHTTLHEMAAAYLFHAYGTTRSSMATNGPATLLLSSSWR